MRGEAPVAGRQPDRLGGAADLAQPVSGQGAEIDPDHDVRVEQREQCVEVAAAAAAIQRIAVSAALQVGIRREGRLADLATVQGHPAGTCDLDCPELPG